VTDRLSLVASVAAALLAAATLGACGDDSSSGELGDACRSVPTELPRIDLDASHPEQTFYLPEDDVDADDLNHVIGDGFLIVRYDEGLGDDEIEELREFSESGPPFQVVAPSADQEEPIVAVTSKQTLRCTEFDLGSLESFAEFWAAETGQAPAQG
jgi:hypothetical protein